MNYYLCPGHTDMRRGIYALYQMVKTQMKRNPVSGEVFIFLGKTRRQIKILHWENDGFLLYHKKLEKGAYETPVFSSSEDCYHIKWRTFVLMLEGVDMHSATFLSRFEMRVK
jgi:hypothetical protein